MLAFIPARGGSKGLLGKNIKLLNNKPLIAYAIEAALNSKYISRIIVSTDDEEIAKVAKDFGAEVPFLRPDFLATDQALALDNYIYTINRLNQEGTEIDEFIVLQPTSPLRTVNDIDNAIQLFKEKEADSIISYTENPHPLHWNKKINKDLTFSNIFDAKLANRQDFEITYLPNGAIYVFKFELIKKKEYYSSKSYAYIMNRTNSVDIDTLEDFEYAEFLLNKRKSNL